MDAADVIREVEAYDVHAAASLKLMQAFQLRFKESVMLRPHTDVISAVQAVAVFEILDDLREHVWARYGPQIQQLLRDERSTAITAAGDIAIDDADVPF